MNGEHRVGLYALCDIQPKQEILFDYDGLNILANKFSWVDDQKKGDLIGNKRLRKDKKVVKNCYDIQTDNDGNSLEEFKSNLDKNSNSKKGLTEMDENTGDDIQIDIFDIKKQ